MGVKVLKLYLQPEEGKFYDLPVCVTEAKSLIKLELGWGIRIGQEFLKHSMKLSYVKMLSLRYVLFTHEGVMEHLISLCPLIEHLDINFTPFYHGNVHKNPPILSKIIPVKSLSLRGLQKLKKVDLQGIQEVHIDSSNVEYLFYEPWDLNAPFKLDFDSCTTLRFLILVHLQSTAIVDKWFVELFSKHPFLEILKIYKCSVFERINISSAQLKLLELIFCPNLKEVNVYTVVDFQHFYSLREFFIRNVPQKILASLALYQ